MLNETLFEAWSQKEKRVSLAKKRRYPHFDPKINFENNISRLRSYLGHTSNVASHAFYPFIKSDIITPRYKKTDKVDGKGKSIRVIDNKTRPIAYAAHFDAYIYSWYSTLLTSRYERKIQKWGIHDNVLAYLEKDKSNIEFAHEVFEYVRNKGECVVLAFDISSFFDGLDHEHLKKMWGRVLNKSKLPDDHYAIFKSLTNYSFVQKEHLEDLFPEAFSKKYSGMIKSFGPSVNREGNRICNPDEFRSQVRGAKLIEPNPFFNKVCKSPRYGFKCGIPQGSPISACLSNIYMIEFDLAINKWVGELGGLYRRYCDDIVVVVNIPDFNTAKEGVLAEIVNYHLEINEKKTETTYFKLDSAKKLRGHCSDSILSKQRTLQYLGFEFNGQDAYIRSSSMSRYYRNMTARIRENLKAAGGKNAIGTVVFKKTLLSRYTQKGKRNFISYAERAKNYMNSETINKQYKNSVTKVNAKLKKKKIKFEEKRKS
jgi:RNA-directed DNA polymerase